MNKKNLLIFCVFIFVLITLKKLAFTRKLQLSKNFENQKEILDQDKKKVEHVIKNMKNEVQINAHTLDSHFDKGILSKKKIIRLSINFYRNQQTISKSDHNVKILEKIANKPNVLQEVSEIITNLDKTKEKYGNYQAYIRIYALKIIEIASFKYNKINLLESIIRKNFNNYDINIKHNGYKEDLIDLIHIWIESYGKKNLLDRPYVLFLELNYQKKMRHYFATALRYSFGEKVLEKNFYEKFSEYM